MNTSEKITILKENGYGLSYSHGFWSYKNTKTDIVVAETRRRTSTVKLAFEKFQRENSMITTVEDEYERANFNQPESPAAEASEAIEATFKVGDKVRVRHYNYDADEYDTIDAIDNGVYTLVGSQGHSVIDWRGDEKNLVAFQPEPAPQLVTVPDLLAEKNNRIAKLESVVSTLQSRIDTDAAYMTSLEARNEKLEADLASAKEIVVQAGAMVEKKSRSLLDALEANVTLRKENEALQSAIEEARQALSNQTHGGAQYQPDVLEADSILANALTKTASTEAPAASEVTLSEDELEFLASIYNGHEYVFILPFVAIQKFQHLLIHKYDTAHFGLYRLADTHNTAANLAAIARRRATLAQS